MISKRGSKECGSSNWFGKKTKKRRGQRKSAQKEGRENAVITNKRLNVAKKWEKGKTNDQVEYFYDQVNDSQQREVLRWLNKILLGLFGKVSMLIQ